MVQTSVGKETGTLSELLAHAPAFNTLMFTMSREEREGERERERERERD